MSISPHITPDGVLSIAISCNGKLIADDINIISVFMAASTGQISTAKLVVCNNFNEDIRFDFPASDSTIFSLGNEIEIRIGYDNKRERIFKGAIVKHSINISSESNPKQLIINCESTKVEEHKEVSSKPELAFAFGVNILELTGEISYSQLNSDYDTTGFLKFLGTNKAQPGTIIELQDVGDRLNGEACIYSVEHIVTDGEWLTEVEFIAISNKIA